MSAVSYDVVIVGAGPSGLSLAIELGMRNVRCLIIERNDRVGYAPRAKTTNVRTRTHLRRWGIAERLAELSPFGLAYPSNIVFVTKLGGFGLARIENASNCDPARSDLYPEHGQWIPQYKLEQILRERAESLPSVSLRFATELTAARESGERVQLTLRDLGSDTESIVDCDYAVGADGARSAMRGIIGATMQGAYGLSRNYNVVFRARGLAAMHEHGPATMYWQVNPVAPSLIGPMDEGDVWFFMPTRLPDDVTLTMENAPDLIRAATGMDIPIEVISVDEWVASSLIADRYRRGRLFLIGDACHLHPPFGGYGMNLGVADGVDLGWKLAATIKGWGGPRLLDSYEAERRGIHEEVIAEAAANHAVLSNDFWSSGLEEAGSVGDEMRRRTGERIVSLKSREFHTLGTVLGGCYRDSPILPSHVAGLPERGDTAVYRAASLPGCLAPHAWREDGVSLYDLFGEGFTLLARRHVTEDVVARATADAARLPIPMTVVRLREKEADLYTQALTLVRPDQVVAWSGATWEPDALRHAAGWAPA